MKKISLVIVIVIIIMLVSIYLILQTKNGGENTIEAQTPTQGTTQTNSIQFGDVSTSGF